MAYQCSRCDDITFSSKNEVVRHVEEKHSGFRWECHQCSKLFPCHANGTHNDRKGKVCKGTVFLCVAPDGSRGSTARNQLDNWIMTALPSLWKSARVKGQRKRRPSTRDSPPNKRAKPDVVSDVSPAKSIASLPPSLKVSLGFASSSSRSRSPSPKKTARKVMSKAVIKDSSSSSSERSPSPSTPQSKDSVALSLETARKSVNKALPDVAPILTSSKKKPSVVPTLPSARIEDLLELQEAQETQLVLNIGGSDFRTSRSTLLKDPQSKLARMLSKDSPVRLDKGGKYFLDRDSHHFRFILNYLRNNCKLNPRLLPNDVRYLNEMLLEAEYYNLKGLVRAINTRLRALEPL